MEDGHCIRTVHAEMNALIQCAKEGSFYQKYRDLCDSFSLYQLYQSPLASWYRKDTYKANYRPHPFAIELMEQKGVSYLQHDVPEVHLGMDD